MSRGNTCKLLCWVQFRVFLPLTLLAASALRYNALSSMYLLCLLISPLLRAPTTITMRGATGLFLKILVALSVLPVLGHIAFHVTLVAVANETEPYGHMFENCSYKEKLVRQIGFQRLDHASVGNIMRLVVPDAIVFSIAIFTLVLSAKLTKPVTNVSSSTSEMPLLGSQKVKHKGHLRKILSDFLQNLFLVACGVIVPSILGGVYFIIFLVLLTLWGCYKTMGHKFGYVRIVLLTYTGLHIMLLHLYQYQFFQEALDPEDLIARLIGLTGVVKTDCSDVDSIIFYPNVDWFVFVNPGLLLVLHFILAHNVYIWSHRRRSETSKESAYKGAGERQRLVEHEEPPGGHYGGVDNGASSSLAMDPAQSPASSTGLEGQWKVKRRPSMSIVFLVMRQSYVLSLIAMMAWSITYHSWLTFVLLLAACLLWMLPNSRAWCLRASPFLVVYALLLLIGQYIFCMDLKDELPKMAGTYELDEIGFKRFKYPSLNLALEVFFTLFLVMTMRQYMGERKPPPQSLDQGIKLQQRPKRMSILDRLLPLDLQEHTYDSRTMVFIGEYMWLVLCKYWIIVCVVMMAIISLQDVVIYRIIYMFLLLFFILLFQFNFTLWRNLSCIFWWVMIVYSMIVLIIIYTYQFKEFHGYWVDVTGFDNNLLKDIGLEKYDTAGLFAKLLTPTSFLVIVILQLRYFHEPFLKLSALDRYVNLTSPAPDEGHAQNITEDEEESSPAAPDQPQNGGSLRNWIKKKILAATEIWMEMTKFLWRLGEIHFFKLVALIIMVVAITEVSALTSIYVLLLVLFMPIRKVHTMLSHLAQLWTVVIILAKMIYQLNLIETEYWKTNCSFHHSAATNVSNYTSADNAIWFGLDKINTKNFSISYYLRLYLVILVLIAIESMIRYHQKQHYNSPNINKAPYGIIFVHITRPDADNGIFSCIKFFANYMFYKFGLETCYIMTAITLSIRVDAVALIYIAIVGILLILSRRTVARIWPFYKFTLAAMLAIQFFVVLGFPLGACIEYPWTDNSHFSRNLKQWLFLPEYVSPPESVKLLADFFQLLFVSLQAFVFKIESHPERMEVYGGGDNSDIVDDVEQGKPNPYKDFTIQQRKAIDTLKLLVFENMFWVTMAIIFITGATRINIFSLFYVIADFYFMWYGKEFFLKPLRSLIRMWNLLIGYCILVLFMKTALQLIGCVYVNTLIDHHQCWLVQLFGVNCLLTNVQVITSHRLCTVEVDDAGLAWDVVCLAFLLIQRRVFASHYFRHVVDTIDAQNNLVSRGAELINRIMIREVNKQNEQEHKILIHIKNQMKTLKKRQARLKKDFKEPEEHFQAIRAGDYYLFEDEEEEDKTQPTSLTFGTEPEDPDENPSPLQVINTAHDQGISTAIETYPGEISIGSEVDAVEKEEEAEKESDEPETVSKVKVIANFIKTLWFSFIDWLIRMCNRTSRNYRLVAKKLSNELVIEKQKIVGSRTHRPAVTGDKPSDHSSLEEVQVQVEGSHTVDGGMFSLPKRADSNLSLDELERQDEEELKKQFTENKDRFNRLLTALGLLLASRSEVLCYFLMILNQMVYGSLLSLPLPLMVFLWGMLSVPRPSKTFWITVITYTEAVVVCKYLFQFGFFPWNDGTIQDSPFFPPRIIGIEKVNNYANVDIALLLALFLHRSILRKYGLWRDAADITADLEAAGIKEQSAPASPEKEIMGRDERVQYTLDPDAIHPPSELTESKETEHKSQFGQGLAYIINPFTKFFTQVTQSSYNATADVYAPMFLCDFILFLVVVFGFSSFGPADTTSDKDVTAYIKDNKIPIPFLIMLITQFIFIVIDRALFLRKNVLGKFIFQILLVILTHVWMFFILPAITKRSFFNNKAAQIWYFIKCIYFGLSAYQIRCGYPNRILGNFLTKNYGYTNLFLFKGFLAIPFLLELRALMDWIWTDSTLAIGNWLQMEDVYANIFVLKCWREIEKTYPTERAIKKSPIIKYISGGALLVVIIFIIWFPLVFFSFFNAVFIPNPPFEAKMSINIGGYQPMFTTTALGPSIRTLTGAEFSTLKSQYSRDRNAYSFISGFDATDVTLTAFDGNSLAIWGISPASQRSLVEDLENDTVSAELSMTVEVKFFREPDKSLPGEVSNLFEINLRNPRYKTVRHQFAAIVNGTSNASVVVEELFPRFLRLSGQAKAIPADQLTGGPYGIGLSNISMELQRDTSNPLSEWWNVAEVLTGTSVFSYKANDPKVVVPKAHFITFNDRKAPASLSFLSGYGIIGLYISFILLIGRLLRLSTTNQYLTIMFRELPDVDRMMRLCLDIYLVREMKEFHLEEDLYAMLIFLYRSPETTIKYTRQTIRIGNLKKDDKEKED